MAEARHSSSPSSTPAAGRPVWRGIAWGVGLVATAALTLWLLSPWLAVPLAQRYLPEGWSLTVDEFERPGPAQTRMKGGRVSGRLAGLEITVELDELTYRYAGPALHAGTVRVTAVPVIGDDPAAPLRLQDLAMPRLVLPNLDATVAIDRLVLQYGREDDAVSGSFEQLRLDGASDAVRLEADLAPNAFVRDASRLNLHWSAERFELDWRPAGSAQRPGIRLTQVSRSGPDLLVDGLLEADLDLGRLNPSLLEPLANALGLDPFQDATGRFSARVELEGVQALVPARAQLDIEGLQLANSGTRIDLDLAASIGRTGEQPAVRISHLSASGEGPLPRINEAFANAFAALPLEGLDAGAPFAFAMTAPRDPATPLELRLTERGDELASFAGGLEFDASLADGTLLSARLPDVQWTRGEAAQAVSAEGLELDLRRNRTLIYGFEEGELGFGAAELRLVGDVRSTGAGLVFRGNLEIAEFSDFSVSQPAATARLRTLGLAGPLEVGSDTLRFEGAIGGAGFVVAPADAVAASSLLTAESFTFDLLAEGQDITALSGRGRLNGIALPDLGVRAAGVDLEVESLRLPAVDGMLGGLTTGLEIRLEETRYSGLDLELRGALRAGRYLQGDGSLLLGFTGELPFRYVADLQEPTLEANLAQARLGAGALADAARALALPLPETLAFEGGELLLDGSIAYAGDALRGALDVRGNALALALGESRFDGLNFTTRVDVAEVISGRGPLALELANLAAGLDLTTLNTSIEFEGADFGLLSFDARLLGGALRTPALKLAGGQLQGTLFEWTGFDLGQLLAFIDVAGLEGTGTIDATIPIVNDGAGPAVEAGRFAARGPGMLRYRSGAPATNIGLQALENFQYDTLEGQLDYGSDGAYTIALDLLGRNPDLYGGHPVRFRLNLGGEMPALFRSLFITGDFEKAIIERLRAGEPALPEGSDSSGTEP